MVYQNTKADVMILELLQDIPPHWNISYAGKLNRQLLNSLSFSVAREGLIVNTHTPFQLQALIQAT